MDISVVVPARNEACLIDQQLEALGRQQYDGEWEVIVVDNGSTDATAAIVASRAGYDHRFKLVRESDRTGLCHARNAGIRAAGGAAILLCDADDVVADGWLAACAHALQDHDLVTGPLELKQLNPASLASMRGDADRFRIPSFGGIFEFPHGNNLGVTRRALAAIGCFDQSFIGAEDAEFGLRAAVCGVDVHFEKTALVHYRFRTSPADLWRQGIVYGRARPAVARRVRHLGFANPPRFAGWRSWARLALMVPTLYRPDARSRFTWIAANRLGQVLGSIKDRTMYL